MKLAQNPVLIANEKIFDHSEYISEHFLLHFAINMKWTVEESLMWASLLFMDMNAYVV